jgi:hypothetical protein
MRSHDSITLWIIDYFVYHFGQWFKAGFEKEFHAYVARALPAAHLILNPQPRPKSDRIPDRIGLPDSVLEKSKSEIANGESGHNSDGHAPSAQHKTVIRRRSGGHQKRIY